MYSITKEGKVIFIPESKPTKLEYYQSLYGVFMTEQEARDEANKRKKETDKLFFGLCDYARDNRECKRCQHDEQYATIGSWWYCFNCYEHLKGKYL